MYGPRVQVDYYDVTQPEIRAAHADVLSALREDRLPLPAILLNGHVLYTGAINPLRVVAAVAEVVQRGNA